MPVKRKRYVKNMDKVWKTYDKSMTSLMALMCGRLHMVFMTGELRMVDYVWSTTYGLLHMVLIKDC